ncbi:hypothetical protein R1flu_020374 [Riccia fluitans]|uniref:Uncharacterized protein n=1 Tax=Riccia fluitans TaxID=41844 RepID=A0ABD1ZLB6_9MARC
MGVLALERGDAFLQLHVQGMMRVKTSSTCTLKAEIKRCIGWDYHGPIGGSICIKSVAHDSKNLRAERIWRACTIPQSVEVRDVNNILFGIDTPARYFQTGSEGSRKEENEHCKQQANEGAKDRDGPTNDDAMSRIPIVDLDRNIDSGANLDRVRDALLYTGFGVRMMNSSNNDSVVHALTARNSELGTKPLLPPNYRSPAVMAVADLGTVMFHAGEAGVGGMLGDWAVVMIQSFWRDYAARRPSKHSSPW